MVKNNRLMDMILLQESINLMHAIDTHINSNQLKRKQSERQKGLLKIKKKTGRLVLYCLLFGIVKASIFFWCQMV